MGIREVEFPSHNGRDQIQAWIYEPVRPARAVVQVVHGLGEHSRRYLHLISTLLDAGFVVSADDHAGHGRTAMVSGEWGDTGEDGVATVVEDEATLRSRVRDLHPELPFFLFGHSWGSMIGRAFATAHGEDLAGLALCGVAAQIHGIDAVVDRAGPAARIAAGEGSARGGGPSWTRATRGCRAGLLPRSTSRSQNAPAVALSGENWAFRTERRADVYRGSIQQP